MHKLLISVSLLMALITLSACSQTAVPAATESPTPVESDILLPTPTMTPEPTPSPTPVVQPDYYPPTDFEVASVWKADAFGDDGGALLYMSDIADGTVSLKVYMYQYVCGQSTDRRMNLSTFTATANYDGENYLFSADQGNSWSIGVDSLIKLDGTLSFSEEKLTFEYIDAAIPETYSGTAEFCLGESAPNIRYENEEVSYGNYTNFLPATFTRVLEEEAGTAMYDMPMFRDELFVPPYSDETAEGYFDWYYSASDSRYIPLLRNIGIGDTIEEVISRFPHEFETQQLLGDIQPDTPSIVLYGNINDYFKGEILFQNGEPSEIHFCHGDIVTFILDEDLRVCEIRATL